MNDYEKTLEAEAQSWYTHELTPAEEAKRIEKYRRERIRHYKLVKDLLLDKLNTQTMNVLEVGGGPMPVSDLLRFSSRTVVDPLSDEYRKVLPCPDHVAACIENWTPPGSLWRYDLAIATNSLDHVFNPSEALVRMFDALTPHGYLAIAGAENNAITHPHPAHVHNLTADWVHRILDPHCETVWELTYDKDGYRYGWREYEGKRGQPAFALLMRKCG